jgi:hypothetical protein
LQGLTEPTKGFVGEPAIERTAQRVDLDAGDSFIDGEKAKVGHVLVASIVISLFGGFGFTGW